MILFFVLYKVCSSDLTVFVCGIERPFRFVNFVGERERWKLVVLRCHSYATPVFP